MLCETKHEDGLRVEREHDVREVGEGSRPQQKVHDSEELRLLFVALLLLNLAERLNVVLVPLLEPLVRTVLLTQEQVHVQEEKQHEDDLKNDCLHVEGVLSSPSLDGEVDETVVLLLVKQVDFGN